MRQAIPQGVAAIPIVDTKGRRMAFSLQNVSAADVYYSDDQRSLDSVDRTNLPTVGHLLPGSSTIITVYPVFIGKLWARTQGVGAALEIMPYEIDLC
jgi:hypothetical protein